MLQNFSELDAQYGVGLMGVLGHGAFLLDRNLPPTLLSFLERENSTRRAKPHPGNLRFFCA